MYFVHKNTHSELIHFTHFLNLISHRVLIILEIRFFAYNKLEAIYLK